MKTPTELLNETLNAPTRTSADALVLDTVAGAGTFVYSYPYPLIRGRVTRFCDALTRYWAALGFDVLGCASIEHTLRKIQPGQVWIVWRGGSQQGRAKLRVVGMRPNMAPGQ